MRFHILPLMVIMLLFSSASYALVDDFDVYTQDDAEWVKQWEGNGLRWSNIEVDDHNNLFILCYATDNVTCDDGNPLSNFKATGEENSFLAMINAEGRTSWVTNSATRTFSNFVITSIAPASDGAYIIGVDKSAINELDNSEGYTGDISAGRFVGHFDTSGNLEWTDDFSDSIWRTPAGILSDTSGNLYASMFEGGAYGAIPLFGGMFLDPQSQSAMAVRKYDIDGNLLWEKEFCDRMQYYQPVLQAVSDTEAMHILGMTMGGDTFDLFADPSSGLERYAFWDTEPESYREDGWTWISDDGYIYSCGEFYATADFDPSADEYPATVIGQSDIYLIKQTLDGEIVTTAEYGGQKSDTLQILLPDGFGGFIGLGDLDYSHESVADPSHFYIFGITSDLDIEWAIKLDGGSVRWLTVAPNGDFYVGGYHDGAFIAKFDAQTFRSPFFSESTGF